MRFRKLLCILFFVSLLLVIPTSADRGHLYTESIDAYSRIEGETLRWTSKREFLIRDYNFYNVSISPDYDKNVDVEVLHDTNHGQYEILTQPAKKANFNLIATFRDDGRVLDFAWDMYYFRDTNHPTLETLPLDTEIRDNFRIPGNRKYDLDSTNLFFSINLQYNEYLDIEGDVVEVKVNTELGTKNYADGRIERSSIHIVKRLADSTVIFEYNWVYQEVSSVLRYFNFIDQPFLEVPAIFAAVALIIYVYIKFNRFISKYGIKIVKTKTGDGSDQSSLEETAKESSSNKKDAGSVKDD
ncbi:MAG: hypothetical protein IH840_06875 [Candidatus Heimdallarchaeota archaeon]|nr:hypothetical protein [Candidatus Heimdallarchaeota archaeon]